MNFDQPSHADRAVIGQEFSCIFPQIFSLILLTCGLAPNVQAADGRPAASFFESFDRLDPNFWYISDGWTNGDHQNCIWSAKMIKIADGFASLMLAKDTVDQKAMLCAEIQTKQRYGFGTYEARIKAAAGSGLNSAFFSYIGPADQEEHDEIDFEVLGKNSAAVQVNQYVKAKGGNEKLVSLAGPADEGFNHFAFTWEPSRLRFFVNGFLVNEVTDTLRIPTARQKIFFSLWGTDTLTGWMGPFAYKGPAIMQVDWVSFTATGERCLFAGSLTCDGAIPVSAPAKPQENP
ncbi:endo-1,3-1,4-beta-glycanase ExoK [Rhizobium mongolense subsp. loessense]|uniref:Beta-glucanase n=1 Tax=Rhizobium mongolense subsp. loessense TaxID=158890 RepID=A0A1G4TLX4_9HYPH|nr:family 16 glycosylhydrolase [Rhizobium mongolense]SCW82247.1 endo-1,3-1,4-beta-glycanase ExoK [Rhizobium mongolense subsp. loessense]